MISHLFFVIYYYFKVNSRQLMIVNPVAKPSQTLYNANLVKKVLALIKSTDGIKRIVFQFDKNSEEELQLNEISNRSFEVMAMLRHENLL